MHPKLSIVCVFYNMVRESARTLYSLSYPYQRNTTRGDWEVIAVDNGSAAPLDEEFVRSFGTEFRYEFFRTESDSPVEAINHGATLARGEHVAIMIDGARMASPGLIHLTLASLRSFENAFVTAPAWHLGPDIQNRSILSGYDQAYEDEMLATVHWRDDGYDLFNISTLAMSSSGGILAPINEANFCALGKDLFDDLNGFDAGFETPGGGLANLDFYKRVAERPDTQLIQLLGEGTFHQFHGGVATNVPLKDHPLHTFKEEYRRLRGRDFCPTATAPYYFGKIPEQAQRFVAPDPPSA